MTNSNTANIDSTTATLSIWRDNDAESPRKWDNLGTMLCAHSRYTLGDEQTDDPARELFELACKVSLNSNFEEWAYSQSRYPYCEESIMDVAHAILKKRCVMLDLYLYDHSGITMRTTPFSCPWDSGKVGIIYATQTTIENEYGAFDEASRAIALSVLEAEVRVYDQYLTGEVFGFTLEDEQANEIASCGGFYGDDPENTGMKDYIPDAYHYLLADAFNNIEYS